GTVLLELEPAAEGGEAPANETQAEAPAAKPAEAAPVAAAQSAAAPAESPAEEPARRAEPAAPHPTAPAGQAARTVPVPPADTDSVIPKPHASPSVRLFARELGVDLYKVRGSGAKQRITREDVAAYVKAAVNQV